MKKGKFGNEYKLEGETTIIYIKRRDGIILESYIDTEDLPRLIAFNRTWSSALNKRNKQGIFYYALVTVFDRIENNKRKGRSVYLHSLIMNAPEGSVVDHRDKNTLDNRKLNLRITDQSINMKNRTGINRNNKSGYRNVCWIKGKWIVQLQIDGKNTRLKEFDDVHEAGRFAEEMRKKYYKE